MQAGDIDEPLVDAIYAVAAGNGDWNAALDRFRALTGSCEAALTMFDHRKSLLTQQTACRMLTADVREKYVRHYGALDPKMRILAARDPGFLFNDAEHFDEAFVGRDPFYQEFTRSIGTRHTLDMLVRKGREKQVYLAAMHSSKRGPYDLRAARLFRQASRHFVRAIALREKLEFARHAAGAIDQLSAGIIVIGEHGRIELANRPVKSVLDSACGLRLCRGKLSACSVEADHRLKDAIAKALAGVSQPSVLRVPRTGKNVWTVWVMPLPDASPLSRSNAPAALLVLGDPARLCLDASELSALYGLTKAEAELAIALGNGETLNEVAARRRVKSSTVRTQLLSILGKTGFHRQADLTRILASLSRPVAGIARPQS